MNLLLGKLVTLSVGVDFVWNSFARSAADPANAFAEAFTLKIVLAAISSVANEAAFEPRTILARLVFVFRRGLLVVVMMMRRPGERRVQEQ